MTNPKSKSKMKLVTHRWELIETIHDRFCIAFHFVGWGSIQLGLHFDITRLNAQIHIPFGFIHIGQKMASAVEYFKKDGDITKDFTESSMSISEYKQIIDDEPYNMKYGDVDRQKCCNCGLVHDVVYKKQGRGIDVYCKSKTKIKKQND